LFVVGHFVSILAAEANTCGIAYAYLGAKTSYYQGARTLQTYVHEIGHNIGLGHSGSIAGNPPPQMDTRYVYGDQYVT
jgi:hypothetical protein